MVWNLLTSVELCGSCGVYGLYKVTMDLVVCYEFKSEFADVVNNGQGCPSDCK
jgi:hypothetical protein